MEPVEFSGATHGQAPGEDPAWGQLIGRWIRDAVLAVWHTPPQRLAAYVIAVVAATVAARLGWREVRRQLRARAAAQGTWVKVTPPRTVDVSRSADVWRLLHSLAKRADRGLARPKPPMSVEVHADGGRLSCCIWVPAWVPLPAVVADVQQAWPGALVQPWLPPPPAAGKTFTAGCRLAVQGSQHASVIREQRLTADADPLRAVLSSLGQIETTAVLQVLVRPAKAKRTKALRRTARGLPPRRPWWQLAIGGIANAATGTVQEAASVVLGSPSAAPQRQAASPASYGPDPLQRQDMRDAAAKLADRPHLEAAIRVTVTAGSRAAARAAARSIMDGYAVAGGDLVGVRLPRPVSAVRDRWVHAAEWLLLGPQELAVLAHLPADPAWFGFATAALARPFPKGAHLATPEKARPDASGWNTSKGAWTPPRQPAPRQAPSSTVPSPPNPIPPRKKPMTPHKFLHPSVFDDPPHWADEDGQWEAQQAATQDGDGTGQGGTP